MANQPEIINYDTGIYQFETTDLLDGGVGGTDNAPLLSLANRTGWLKQQVTNLQNSTASEATTRANADSTEAAARAAADNSEATTRANADSTLNAKFANYLLLTGGVVGGNVQINGALGVQFGLSVSGQINTASQAQLNAGLYSAGNTYTGAAAGNTNPFGSGSSGIAIQTDGTINSFFGSTEWLLGTNNVSNTYMVFGVNTVVVGSIAGNGSGGIVINGLSDYRLKNISGAITDPLERLGMIGTYRGNFLAYPDKPLDLILAHEFALAVPEAVTGVKDGTKTHANAVVSKEGTVLQDGVTEADFDVLNNALMPAGHVDPYPAGATWHASIEVIVPQMVDQTKAIPLMIAATLALEALVKEQAATITSLLARVTTLENRPPAAPAAAS